MGILDFWRRGSPKVEKRAAGSGFTAEIMAARESYISGRRGIAELTATAQGCVSLWEGGLSMADVDGTDLIDRRSLALAARSLALRGDALFLIGDNGLLPIADWDIKTRDARPAAYRLSISESGGGRTMTALAAEVLHFSIGADPVAPWLGTAPLRRASLTAGMLHAIETALAEAFETMPLGSQIVPFPEAPEADLDKIASGFRRNRGRVLIRESVNVQAAGGPAPVQDWKPHDLTPDLSRSMSRETLEEARGAVLMAFGVLPGMLSPNTTGPLIREGQRHLAQWVLAPIAACMAEEATRKLGSPVSLDVMRPVQAFDTNGRARAFAGIVGALAQAKEAGLAPGDVAGALRLVNWEGGGE